jgi:hypothetical protein
MTDDSAKRFVGIVTSRPVVVALYVVTLFLWSAMFFYFVPVATGGWFGPTVSIVFGVFSVAPMLYWGVFTSWRVITGKPLTTQEPDVCPHCGQPLPPAKDSHG